MKPFIQMSNEHNDVAPRQRILFNKQWTVKQWTQKCDYDSENVASYQRLLLEK
jgi:hypothetical protein